MKKACVVGYGNIGPVHAAALEKISALYAICDNDTEKLNRIDRDDIVKYEKEIGRLWTKN